MDIAGQGLHVKASELLGSCDDQPSLQVHVRGVEELEERHVQLLRVAAAPFRLCEESLRKIVSYFF